MRRTLTNDEAAYNADSLLFDQVWEFHSDIFDILSTAEKRDLFRYYPKDLTEIIDVFAYRAQLLEEDPGVAKRATDLLSKALAQIGLSLESR